MAILLQSKLSTVLCFIGTLLVQSSYAALPRCSSMTSISMVVEWDAVPNTDLYYVALSTSEGARPFALQTTVDTNLTYVDLNPGMSYYVSIKSHNASEPTIAWAPGWRDANGPVLCKTTTVTATAPSKLSRIGDLAETTIGVTWSWPTATTSIHSKFQVGVLALKGCADCGTTAISSEASWDWSEVYIDENSRNTVKENRTSSVMLHNLVPNSTYFVKVRAEDGTEGDAVHFRTKQTGMMYTTTYRISEYAEDVDFLENHNSATAEGFPLYLMTCSSTGNCQPWNKTQFAKTDAAWDSCEATLAQLCPDQQGYGFNGCVECVDAHHDQVVAACGNYTDKDMMHPGFQVHYYCGIGWPENLMFFSAITEYCVEHLPSPNSDPRWEGFADYVSCNSDEVDAAFNNSARDPTCMCWVYDDRKMSLLPKSEMDSKCSGHFTWFVGETICNCTASKVFPDSTVITDSNPSSEYVGAMPTFLPYGYYSVPQETYPVRIPSGENLSTPKKGACKEGQAPGSDDCKWKRQSAARVLYGPDLFKAGWDDRWIPDTLSNQSHSLKNIQKFADATHSYDHYVSQRCCGC